MAVIHDAMPDHDIFATFREASAVSIAPRLDRDAIVPGIELQCAIKTPLQDSGSMPSLLEPWLEQMTPRNIEHFRSGRIRPLTWKMPKTKKEIEAYPILFDRIRL